MDESTADLEARASAIWCGPCGRLAIHLDAGAVAGVDWLPPGPERAATDPLAREVVRQLATWFEDPARGFDLPLAAAPTPFQQRVRAAMQSIDPGDTRSYGALAAALATAPRAIGGACRANPIPLIVPCHRVVARTGIGGFAGQWGAGTEVERKAWLLAFERGEWQAG